MSKKSVAPAERGVPKTPSAPLEEVVALRCRDFPPKLTRRHKFAWLSFPFIGFFTYLILFFTHRNTESYIPQK